MSNAMTASQLLEDLQSLPETERGKFFLLLESRAFGGDNLSGRHVFAHLAGELFTASEAAEYLEISLPTFRRYVQRGAIAPVQLLGRNQMYATGDLKALKRTRHPQRPATA